VTERVECIVIGAGVVGLACARSLARAGLDVVVIERERRFGEGSSSRNSEVIHAGIYYPTDSMKARLCVRGKALLYDFCAAYGVPHARCGKLIVATGESQLHTLRGYQHQARLNGVGELRWVHRDEIAELEPAIDAIAGVWSPTTGIIDSHALMVALAGDLEAHGGMIAYGTTAARAVSMSGAIRLETTAGDVEAGWVVNAAGLDAPSLARCLGEPSCEMPAPYYAKGHYYVYAGPSPFRHLVYPIAEAAGLGVHVTLDLAGQARFGPDVQWVPAPDYGFDDSTRAAFAAAIRAYFPDLDESRLQPGYTGIRPKIAPPHGPASDFRVMVPREHGVPGLIHLLGIESPGLTASLAIGELVARTVKEC
jgi:L-2-hydroxyglutarate oxidase LhgO